MKLNVKEVVTRTYVLEMTEEEAFAVRAAINCGGSADLVPSAENRSASIARTYDLGLEAARKVYQLALQMSLELPHSPKEKR